MSRPERKKVQGVLFDAVRLHGGVAAKIRGESINGIEDGLCILPHSTPFLVECKASPADPPRASQLSWRRLLEKHNCTARSFIVYSGEEARLLVRHLAVNDYSVLVGRCWSKAIKDRREHAKYIAREYARCFSGS